MSQESKQFEDETENQQTREVAINTEQNGSVFQWAELSSPQVPVSSSLPMPSNIYNGGPSCNQQEYAPTNYASNVNRFNFGNQFGNGIPRTSNGVNNGYNNWIRPIPNTGRFLTRPGWNAPSSNFPAGVRKPKRNRTAFTVTQMVVLEQEYKKDTFLDRTRRTSLARMLELSERVIKIWFQNRRMKDKKIKPDANNFQEEASSTTGMPILVQDQYMGEVFNRNIYAEQYSAASATAMPMPVPMPMAQTDQAPIANGFERPYVPEAYDAYQQQVHLQIQHYGPSPAYSNQIQEIVNDSPPHEEVAPPSPNAANNMADINLDVSWMNSINIDDDC